MSLPLLDRVLQGDPMTRLTCGAADTSGLMPGATPRPGEHKLFAFLTCEPNAVVGEVHPKAMPVILTAPDEIEM